MKTIEKAAEEYDCIEAKEVVCGQAGDKGRLEVYEAQYCCGIASEKGFIAGAEWQLEETKEIMLNNFRKVCGCYVKGKCSIDCEECSFIACETLNDLIKTEKSKSNQK